MEETHELLTSASNSLALHCEGHSQAHKTGEHKGHAEEGERASHGR